MNSPLSAIIRRTPVTCAPSTSVREVLQTMHDLGIGAMVATVDDVPLGVFTLRDVLNRVVLAKANLDFRQARKLQSRLALDYKP